MITLGLSTLISAVRLRVEVNAQLEGDGTSFTDLGSNSTIRVQATGTYSQQQQIQHRSLEASLSFSIFTTMGCILEQGEEW